LQAEVKSNEKLPMKYPIKMMATLAFLLATSITASAQSNPYSTSYKVSESRSFGTFYAEYNPHVWHKDYVGNETSTTFHGISVGFSYFIPVLGQLGFDAGVKGQYLFRNEEKGSTTYKDNMLSATVPVNVVYDFRVTDGLAIDPFVGLYGRYNFSAKNVEETGNTRNSQNMFSKDQAKFFGYDTYDRFQFGWQAGVNFRISDMVTIGAAYWMDLKEVGKDIDLHGFNIMLGANF